MDKQPFKNPRTSHCASGRWIRLLGALAPLIIGELVRDADKRWKYIRIVSVAMAVASEVTWANRVKRERIEERER
jgi:hypothetical protein